MLKLFTRRKKTEQEIAPALTQSEQRSWRSPGPVSGTLPYHLYDQMERDGMVMAALTIKKQAVLAHSWKIVGEDKERVAFIKEVFQQMEGSPRNILFQAMDAFAKGWSVQEINYKMHKGKLMISSVRSKDISQFGLKTDRFGRTTGLLLQIPGETEEALPLDKFVVFSYRRSYGRLKGQSDLDGAYRHWQAKNTLLTAWRIHLERHASPTMLGRYQRGLSPDEQSKLLGSLNQMADATAIVFPDEVEVTSLEVGRGQSQGFMDAIDFHNREMARVILGQTLTTDEGRRVGSLALGKVHLQVLMLQVNAIRQELADTVMTEQVIRPLIELNFGEGEIPRFEFEPIQIEAFTSGRIG